MASWTKLMAITLMAQLGTSRSFLPRTIRSKIKQKTKTLNSIVSMFSIINWFNILAEDCCLYFLNYVTSLPKHVKATLVPRETLWDFIVYLKVKSPSGLERLFW